VLSGSCSGINEIQIRRALENGFTGLPLDPQALIASEAAIEDASARAVDLLAKGASPLLYTALGPKDGVVAQSGADGIAFNTCLGERLGIVFRDILRRSGVRRAVVAGGDTSGHVTNQLGLYALSYRAALVRGCPLCLTHSERPEFDGRELALKGGQMGGESFFSQVRAGMP
jgi:3-oxoisoapionate kinase